MTTYFNLLQPISSLNTLNEKQVGHFKRLTNKDSLFHLLSVLPNSVVKRKQVEAPTVSLVGQFITVRFSVIEHVKSSRRSIPYRIRGICGIERVPLDLVYFNAYERFLQRSAQPYTDVIVSGKLTEKKYGNTYTYQIIHPDHIGELGSEEQWVGYENIYPLTSGLTQYHVRTVIRDILGTVKPLGEWIPPRTIERYQFPSWHEAVDQVHNPRNVFDLSPLHPARLRLSYDELFAKQLSQRYTFLKRQEIAQSKALQSESPLMKKFLESLPFKLTNDQLKTIRQIAYDMAQNKPMHRLVQGDVGSGKTIVALCAALIAIENGHQVALLAPTDILVRQHLASTERLFKDLGIRFCLLTGREKGKARTQILKGIESGEIQLVIGTHALFGAGVQYHSLALAIMDEQHRFGVKQRYELAQKSQNTHILSMTATPIPRTLQLAQYGEMDVSMIREKPPGRKAIDTRTIPLTKLEMIIEFVKRRVAMGQKIFWVCPLVEESDVSDYTAVTIRFEALRDIFGDLVEITHGQMKGDLKEAGLNRFVKGEAQILVATTVIEVGVDVPDATVMIIEYPERFGLAQLHQLRGRIGRGDLDGVCLLAYGENLTYTAQKRLSTMRSTDDGFVLAEEDLRLRGGGDMLGLRQSGLPKFTFAVFDSEDTQTYNQYNALYQVADEDARQLLEIDPTLSETPQGLAAHAVMRLFQCEESEQLKKAG